jgi:signal transduction histidine kinase
MVHEIVETYPSLREATIDINIAEGRVLGNEVALTQCVSNLLGNSIKFMPEDRSPLIKVWTEPTPDFIRLLVRDNGIGIAPADRDRIFEIFARVHSEEVYEGTGIGLSIVKKAVEKMGGRVGLESQVDEGSTFWIDLKRSALT